MNFFKTDDLGGLPYVLDDIRFVQTAVRNAFSALASGISDDDTNNGIIWGCVITDNTTTYDVSAGAVAIDGEIYIIAPATGLTKAPSQYLNIRTSIGTYDAAGLKVFQTGVSYDTYELRFAEAVMSTLAGSYIQLSTVGGSSIPLKRDMCLHNLAGLATTIEIANAAISATGSYVANYSGATIKLSCRKRGRMIELSGGIKHNAGFSPAARTHVATLPTGGYFPATVVFIYGYSYASDDYVIWEIGTDGKIYIRGDLKGTTVNTTTGVILNGTFSV